ncbi:unnamed protein product [Gadus morhua 'NCC']
MVDYYYAGEKRQSVDKHVFIWIDYLTEFIPSIIHSRLSTKRSRREKKRSNRSLDSTSVICLPLVKDVLPHQKQEGILPPSSPCSRHCFTCSNCPCCNCPCCARCSCPCCARCNCPCCARCSCPFCARCNCPCCCVCSCCGCRCAGSCALPHSSHLHLILLLHSDPNLAWLGGSPLPLAVTVTAADLPISSSIKPNQRYVPAVGLPSSVP